MSWVSGLVDVMSTGGIGAIVGAIGGFIARREERLLKKLDIERDRVQGGIRLAELRLEQNHELAIADKHIERAQVEGEIKTELREVDGFVESIKAATKATGIRLVDAIRGLMRPAITAYLLGVTTWLFYRVDTTTGGIEKIPVATITDLYLTLVHQIVFLTVLAVSWWFASRPGHGFRGGIK